MWLTTAERKAALPTRSAAHIVDAIARERRGGELMAGVDVWAAHCQFGLTRTPFTKTVPANKLFDRAAHGEAVARIHYCINEGPPSAWSWATPGRATEEHERHRRVIFVIDEAHLLSPEQLEELRLLSNREG